LTVRYKEFNNPNENSNEFEGNYGYIRQGNPRHYTIWINSGTSLLNQVGTLFHEFGHFLFYTVFRQLFINEKKEHTFCEKIDDTARQGFKEYIEE
jgi:Zn-dependent peptidase ImmA (M78 family)